MTCNQTPKTIVSFPKPPATLAPIGLTGSQSAVGTRFLISDNPETINSTTTTFTNGFATLWSDTSTGNSTVRYRAFLWHYNNTGAPIKVGITLGNAGASSYSIHNLNNAIQVVPIGQISSLGICAAAALVGGTMDSIAPTNSSVAAGQIGVVKEWTVGNGEIVGGVIEFSISNTVANVAMNYRVRTVAANSVSANLSQNQTTVVNYYTNPANNSTHPRGSWGFADIASSVSYKAGSGWAYYNASNGNLDNLMTASNSYKISGAPASQGPADSDKGHYGVKYNLTVTLTNDTGLEKKVKIYVGARGTEYYAGAVKWSGDGVTYKIPAVKSYLDTPGTNQEGVEVVTVTVPSGAVITRIITLSTAGAASTPALIAFQTL